ncbi:glycogen debranching protein GlgX [Rhodopila globiformis]|uniref:4-alpha-glucanotransferase n=1 Tax=Rhodopila globiformis TaxID=1071 RepID=A0A2S6N2R8_RHOGL|nr:glycogen debranching protein GlgX [Rhodopila globiformis]PPQ28886.1 4-alpha-glucanotransferase [Rhodopila globiformis]
MTSLGLGSPEPPGVSVAGDGINVAVVAPHAEAIAISLFDAQDNETARLRLPERTGPVFHGHIPGVPAGTRYGLRAYGPWDPGNGHRFNPAKLLIDPWATAIDRPVRLHPLLFDVPAPRPDDTAPLMPKAIVQPPPVLAAAARPAFDWDRQVIYELHVRGFSMTHTDIPPAIRGTFAALGHPASIAHLTRLGVTAVELMPCAAWTDERHLPALNLTNYWGYNPVAFLAPDPRLAPGGWAEIRAAVDALHAAGIAVILDVVLNHSGESDELGPTLSLRGLDNATYYRLAADRSRYVNDAGCGNVLAMERAIVTRLGTDALRTWALYGGIDGFRLDLAVALGRRDDGFDPDAPFLAAVEQDPVLSRCALIAEPWDVGAGGHQLGAFPPRWGEWNDHFRDTVRRFWRGDPGMLGDFTTRVAGSADIFAGAHRPLTRSINFAVAHDGFPLADLVAFTRKRNEANGENNRDGSDNNLSWNNGVEGPSDDPAVVAARARDARALLATLLLARGTPMLSLGDELGRTQHGNNNAYAQDNAKSWIDWATADDSLIGFTARLIALRQSLAPLFSGQALTGTATDDTGLPDVAWLGTDGHALDLADWNRADNRTLVAALYAEGARAVLVFHADAAATTITLPPPRPGYGWQRVLDSTGTEPADSLAIPARSVTVFQEDGKTAARRHEGVAEADLDKLAGLAGIDPIWWDIDGGYHKVSADTKRRLLAAMRLPAETPGDLSDSLARLLRDRDAPLPPVVVGRADQGITVGLGTPRPAWITLLREDGSRERFPSRDAAVVLPPQPLGRHRLLNEDRPDQICHLIVAPDACYLPPALRDGERRFGIAAHLYSLRSRGDQGVGDFTTLRRLASVAAGAGASMVGLNPLHALFPHDRSRASPYHPSDRRFLDPIYIDVSGLPGGAGLPSAPGPVDYPAVWERKRAVLQAAFRPMGLDTLPAALKRFATFEAIAETLGSAAWQSWPETLRHPTAAGIADFVGKHGELVQFHAFLQTMADAQLAEAAASAARDGLSLGFYRDLAVGAAPDGAEAWAAQDTLMRGVSVGAPPDPFSANGQVWMLPPPDPVAMQRDGYAAFNELLVANMRHAGALRIDHVMGLRRLFVVPDGASPADGAYVIYPLQDLLAQVALQSQFARCLVVGEDLGTVPEGMPATLAACNILSYSVLWFERRDGQIRPPPDWRRLAAACVSTHDLPTLAGWWQGADISEKHGLGLLDDAAAEQARIARAAEKTELIAQLQAEALLEEDVAVTAPMPAAVARAVHAFVSATPALLMLVQADDLAGELEAVNLPGTDRERPNWRRRLNPDVEDLCGTPLARAILSALQARAHSGGSS